MHSALILTEWHLPRYLYIKGARIINLVQLLRHELESDKETFHCAQTTYGAGPASFSSRYCVLFQNVNVKQSLYSSGQALRIPEV
jgi:hypothetical protein